MGTTLTWHEVAIRLILTIIAAGVIGIDRDQRGRSAGLRTNILVGLAACIAMIQANALINSVGKAADSFVVMDTMRLPLGILSGIGFIGAGAIIKRGEMVVGLTTAATLWYVTVMGLCFGGGQITIGIAAFALGFLTLFGLKKIENQMPRQHNGTLRVNVTDGIPDETEIEALLKQGGITMADPTISYESQPGGGKTFGWKIKWSGKPEETGTPRVIQQLATHPEVRRLDLTR